VTPISRWLSRGRPASDDDGRPTVTLLSPAIGTTNAGDRFIETAVRRLLGPDVRLHALSTRRELTRAEIAAINASQAAVICGTNLYQEHWEAPALSARALRRIRVPVVPLGVGASGAERETVRLRPDVADVVRRIHASCALGSARDPGTMELLEGLGIENARLTGCPVLHWEHRATLPELGAQPRTRVLVAARNYLMHHEHPQDHPVKLSYMRQVIDALPPDAVRCVIHETVDAELFERLGIPAEQIVWPASTEEYVELYSDPSSVVLACRLHAGMLALATGAPAVFVGHDTRTYSFCEMVGLPSIRLLDADAAPRSIAGLEAALAGDVSASRIAPETMATLHAELDTVLAASGLGSAA
jgi:polysaccharide pyruvyl transferase WcaK-like protein